MNQSNALIIFSKNLVWGKVKTRLAASVGKEKAFNVYKELLFHTKTVVQEVDADKVVYYSDHVEQNDIWGDYRKAMQQGADLGERMAQAFKEVFQCGYLKAVIIGTDCPALDGAMIQAAFDHLEEQEVVIGPAYDGGYYLLGMKTLQESLFQNIAWSTNTVYEATMAACRQQGLSYAVLPLLHDIDEEKDLVYFKTVRI